MNNPERGSAPRQETRAESEPQADLRLEDFDADYFKELEGEDGWIALDDPYYQNQHYFTVLGEDGERLGIIGAYDTEDEKNLTHTVVDPKFRGQGLARRFNEDLMDRLDLPFLTFTIDLDNAPSLRFAEKMPGARRVSDEAYEQDQHKAKFIYERPEDENE